MDNTQTNLRTTMSPHKLSVNDEMSASITNAIDHLASDGTFFTRMRLRGARSREALKLAETALKESMAAKNRTFVVAGGPGRGPSAQAAAVGLDAQHRSRGA